MRRSFFKMSMMMARALVLVLEVGRVDQDQLVVIGGQIDLLLEDRDLIGGVLVEADFADAQNARVIEQGRNQVDDFAGKRDVLGLLGVDAEPGIMLMP